MDKEEHLLKIWQRIDIFNWYEVINQVGVHIRLGLNLQRELSCHVQSYHWQSCPLPQIIDECKRCIQFKEQNLCANYLQGEIIDNLSKVTALWITGPMHSGVFTAMIPAPQSDLLFTNIAKASSMCQAIFQAPCVCVCVCAKSLSLV